MHTSKNYACEHVKTIYYTVLMFYNYLLIKYLGIISWQKIHIDYRSNSYRDIVDRAG